LARILQPNNSNMKYDSEAALTALKKWVDEEVLLDMPSFTRISPDWSQWHVHRADITGDFIFDRVENVSEILERLRGVKMPRRPKEYSAKTGLKWAAERIALSVYDKYVKDSLAINKGKLRVTVIINDKKEKKHLGKYYMKSVEGLKVSTKWLEVLRDQILIMRPAKEVSVLRFLIHEAWKTQSKSGANK